MHTGELVGFFVCLPVLLSLFFLVVVVVVVVFVSLFFASNSGSSVRSHAVCTSPVKSRKGLTHDAMYSSAAHTGLVDDVTDLVEMAAFQVAFSRLSKIDF